MAGLILQLVSFALFTCMLIAFGFRVFVIQFSKRLYEVDVRHFLYSRSKYPTYWDISSRSESLGSVVGPFKITQISNWKILYFTMCLTCIGILVCVKRFQATSFHCSLSSLSTDSIRLPYRRVRWGVSLSTLEYSIYLAHSHSIHSYFGFLAIHEGYFYLLDALPLWIAMTLYCFVWPARFINKQDQEDAARDTPIGLSLVENGKFSNTSR